MGDLASVVQLTVTLKLIYAIVRAAKNARMHKRNCRQFAQHMKLIAKLLEQLKPQDVEEYPEYRETREPLDHLEQCLKRALVLVENCRDKSYLYLIAMGWSIVNQFKDYQMEIDRYLRLIPLISLVENHRVSEFRLTSQAFVSHTPPTSPCSRMVLSVLLLVLNREIQSIISVYNFFFYHLTAHEH